MCSISLLLPSRCRTLVLMHDSLLFLLFALRCVVLCSSFDRCLSACVHCVVHVRPVVHVPEEFQPAAEPVVQRRSKSEPQFRCPDNDGTQSTSINGLSALGLQRRVPIQRMFTHRHLHFFFFFFSFSFTVYLTPLPLIRSGSLRNVPMC